MNRARIPGRRRMFGWPDLAAGGGWVLVAVAAWLLAGPGGVLCFLGLTAIAAGWWGARNERARPGG